MINLPKTKKSMADGHGVVIASEAPSKLEHTLSPSASKVNLPLNTEDLEASSHVDKGQVISAVVALMLSFILIGLDQNIIGTAVPAISHDFRTITDIGWYSSVYRLTASSSQPLFGKIYSLYSTRRIHLISLLIFACGNLLSGFAPTSSAFIVGRALTGLASAGLVSGCFSLITHTFPLQKRSVYAGIGGGTEAVAGACAPLIGGVLTDHLSWRWCFYLQLPLVLLTLIAASFCTKMSKPERRPMREKLSRLDIVGTTIFVSAITCLLVATQLGAAKYAWSNWRVILLFILFGIMLIAFFYLQHYRQDRAILPPRITLRRNVLFGLLFSACNNGALSIIEYYMPIYFQYSRGMSATLSGVMLLPIIVGLVVSVVLAGFLTSVVGYYNPFMIATSIITPIATGLLTTLTIRTQHWKLVIFQGLLGVGAGIGFQGPQVAVQTILSKEDTPIGLGVVQFAQGIGPAIFVAAAQSCFLTQFKKKVERDGLGSGIDDLMSTGVSHHSLGLFKRTDLRIPIAYAESLSRTFYLATSLSCLTVLGALGMQWRSVKVVRKNKDVNGQLPSSVISTKEASVTAAS